MHHSSGLTAPNNQLVRCRLQTHASAIKVTSFPPNVALSCDFLTVHSHTHFLIVISVQALTQILIYTIASLSFPCHQCLWHPSNEATVCLIFLACHVASSCSNRTVLMGSQCDVREGASSSTPSNPGCAISAGPHSQGVCACYLIYTPANLHKSV